MIHLKIVERYLLSRTGHNRSRVRRIFIGLVLSTAVMLTVISIMDYLQSSRFETIKAVRSFPLTVSTDNAGYEKIKEEYGNEYSIFPYKEGEALMSFNSTSLSMNIRYIDERYLGSLYISGELKEGGILLPYILLRSNTISGPITLTMLEKGKTVRLVPKKKEYTVTGLYSTKLSSDFDSTMLFLPYSEGDSIDNVTVAIIVSDKKEAALKEKLEEEGFSVKSWSERESSLYGAMLMEKIIMEVLLSSLFLIVLVQIIQNASSLAKAKQRECASLLLLGFSPSFLDSVAILSGALLALAAMVVGTFISYIITLILPYTNSLFRSATFTLDIKTVLFFVLLMTLFSALSYLRAFKRVRDKKVLMEVVTTV